MRKKLVAVFCAVALLASAYSPSQVLAKTSNNIIIRPLWINVNSVSASLTFSGTTAYCDASISAFSGTTKINATITLERKNADGTYSHVKTWTESADREKLNFAGSCSVTKGYTYKLTVTASVTRDGVTETVSNWTESYL